MPTHTKSTNTTKDTKMNRYGEKGNVLFLILIAVALFAALSYAVTQSTRSGSNDSSGETNLINSAQITQYPASVRTALVRMIIGGTPLDTPITFNTPSDFTSTINTDPKRRVNAFHPRGGGATYMLAPGDVMDSGNPGTWYFNANFDIPNIGTSGVGGNDLIAFLPGVSKGICDKVNSEHGISSTPAWNVTDADVTESIEDGDTLPTTDQDDFDSALAGQPFGCFNDSSSLGYVYYHVLIER